MSCRVINLPSKWRVLWVEIICSNSSTLQWRHNEHDGVSNHQSRDCLLNRLFRRRSQKTSKLRVTGLCAGNSPVIGKFPAQRASNAENVSIWWYKEICRLFALRWAESDAALVPVVLNIWNRNYWFIANRFLDQCTPVCGTKAFQLSIHRHKKLMSLAAYAKHGAKHTACGTVSWFLCMVVFIICVANTYFLF